MSLTFREFLLEAEKLGPTAKVGLDFQMRSPLTVEEIKDALEKIPVKGEIKTHEPDDTKKKSPKLWHVQPNATLGEGGIEIFSPAIPLNDALRLLKGISEWMQNSGAETSTATSLRILVQIPHIEEKLDPVKLVLFMGDEHGARALAKHAGKISVPQQEVISQKIKSTGKLPVAMDAVEKDALQYLSLRGGPNKMAAGYLELRVQGGSGYEYNVTTLREKIFKLVRAVEIACDPSSERAEYREKLIKLLGSTEAHAVVTKDDIEDLPESLHRLYRYNPDINEAWKVLEKDQVLGDARRALMTLINTATKTAHKFKTSLTLGEKQYFKGLAKEVALQHSDVDEYFGNDHTARQKFKKDIGL